MRGGKILRQGAYPLPYDLDFSYSLVCGYIWSCILFFAHTQDSGVDQVDVSPYQAGFQLNWCFCTSFGRNPLCSCPGIC